MLLKHMSEQQRSLWLSMGQCRRRSFSSLPFLRKEEFFTILQLEVNSALNKSRMDQLEPVAGTGAFCGISSKMVT